MAFTVTSSFGRRWAAQLQPWTTDDLLRFVQAIGEAIFDQVLDLVEEEGTDGEPGYVPPWGKLFDPDLCPAKYLPYLAMYVGATIPITASEIEARAIIKEEQGFTRGTTASIEIAIYKNSTLVKTSHTLVERGILIERRNAEGSVDAYHFLVVLEESLIPNQAALESAINANRPGGVLWTLITTEGLTWAGAPGTWSEATHTWAGATKEP